MNEEMNKKTTVFHRYFQFKSYILVKLTRFIVISAMYTVKQNIVPSGSRHNTKNKNINNTQDYKSAGRTEQYRVQGEQRQGECKINTGATMQ